MAGKRITSAKLALDNAALQRALTSSKGPVAVVVRKATAKAERYAKQRCPVDTGRLRASITSRIATEKGSIVGYVGTDVEYAAPVEFGAQGRAPVAFLRGGVEQALSEEL